MKKKILIFLQSNVGGAERVSVTIGKNIDAEFFDVFFYAVGPWDCEIADFIPSAMFKEHLKYSNPLKLVMNLYKVIQRESPDIIFSSTMYISTKLLLLKPFFSKIKFVVRSENNFFTFNQRQQWMIRFLYRRAEKIIAQTDEMARELNSQAFLPSSKIKVIQNPQDFDAVEKMALDASPYIDSQKVHFVASGRFCIEKGFDVLVKAFSLVEKKINNAELFIVGKNTGGNEKYYIEIKKLITDYGIENKVFCVGYKKNPYVYIKNADCFVLSSRNEGLPNVLIEALYLGTPVAATKCIPVVERIVEEGKTGFLANSDDALSLSEAMLKAVNLGRIHSSYPMDTLPAFKEMFQSFLT